MKKFLKLLAVLVFCILLGGCGSEEATAPNSISSLGDKITTSADAPYSGEFEIQTAPEKVELELLTGGKKEFYKIKFSVNNTSEHDLSMPYAYSVSLVNADKKEIFSKTMLISAQSDEIKSEITPGTTEEGYVYLEANRDDNDNYYKYSDARYIKLSVLVSAEQKSETSYSLGYEDYYVEFK